MPVRRDACEPLRRRPRSAGASVRAASRALLAAGLALTLQGLAASQTDPTPDRTQALVAARAATDPLDLRQVAAYLQLFHGREWAAETLELLSQVDYGSLPPGWDTYFDYFRACALRRTGEFEEALTVLSKGLDSIDALPDGTPPTINREWLVMERARVHLDTGSFENAATSLSGVEDENATVLRIGIALATEDFRTASQLCDELLATSGSLDNVEYRTRIQLQRAQALERQNPSLATLEELQRLAKLEDVSPGLRSKIQMELAAALIDRDRPQAAAKVFSETAAAVRAKPALRRAAAPRGAAVFARLALDLRPDSPEAAEFRPEVAAELLQQTWSGLVREWQTTPFRSEGSQFLQYGTRRDVLALLIRLVARIAESPDAAGHRAFETWLEAEQQDALVRGLGLTPPNVEELRELVPANGGVLIYVPAPAGTAVLAIERSGMRTFALEDDRKIMKALAPLANTVSEPGIPVDTVRKHGLRAREALFPEPLWNHIQDWHAVWIVGGELLRSPAWEAIPDGSAYLGTTRAVAHLPTITTARWLSDRPSNRSAARTSLTVVAGDEPPATLRERHRIAPLRASPSQWDSVAAPFDSGATRILRGSAARAADLGPLVASSSLVTFVAHGILEPERARPRGLALADRGLFSDDLEAFDLPPLVTFLSCRGAGTPSRGESAAPHIGGAAVRAGATAVLIADQPVWLESGLELAGSFHAHLLDEDEPDCAEALRRARAGLLQSGRYGHPAHHAAMRVMGWPALRPRTPTRAQRSLFESVSRVGLATAAAALALVVGALFLTRRRAR